MNLEQMNSITCRILFFGSFLLLAIAVLEHVVNQFGYTIAIVQATHTPGQLLEWSTVLLMFLFALLLRQVREEVKKLKT